MFDPQFLLGSSSSTNGYLDHDSISNQNWLVLSLSMIESLCPITVRGVHKFKKVCYKAVCEVHHSVSPFFTDERERD